MAVECPQCRTGNTSDSQFCKKCATPLPRRADITKSFTKTVETQENKLARGTTIAGRYEIIEELGRGGMGRVYRVFDRQIEEEVALKILRSEIASDKQIIDRFRNELKFTRKITHKNVCRMYDLNEHAECHFITMEYVTGEDIKS